MTIPSGPSTAARPVLTHPGLMVLVALAVGAVFDVLVLRHPIGLGATLVGLAPAGAVIAGRTLFGWSISRESFLLAGALGIWSGLLFVREAPMLVAMNAAVAVLLLGMVSHLLRRTGLGEWTIATYVRSGLATLGGWLGQPFAFFRLDLAGRWPASGHLRTVARVVLGLSLALPLLGIFAALFSSADPVFEAYLNGLLSVDIDLESIAFHVTAVPAVAWLTIGAVRYAHNGRSVAAGAPLERRILGTIEASTILVLLNALFLAFVIVQSAYLFGGRETLTRSGLTYAEYARRGFFELVLVGSLVVALVLIVDWLVQRQDQRARTVDWLHGGLIILTGVVLVSAVQRMRLYTEAFGLTELRVYTTVFMGWVFLMLGWMTTTVLRRRRARFALGAFVSALLVLATLTVANPAALIVRTNVGLTSTVSDEVDIDYLIGLGPDGVPALVQPVDRIEPCATRVDLASRLLAGEGLGPAGLDWRSATWSSAQADRAVDRMRSHLAEVAAGSCS